MEKVKDNKAEVLSNIQEMKNGSFEQMALITFYSLSSYLKSLFAFGSNSSITKDNLNVIKEMFRILKKERKLLNYILANIDSFDIDAVSDVVIGLDQLNEETVLYYYRVLDDIEEAVDMRDEFRGLRAKNGPKTLIQTDAYAKEVIALAENFESLKAFLGFEEEFWQFIEKDNRTINAASDIQNEMVYATPLLDENGNIVRILILAPKIVDLNSALLAIHIYKRAYDIYKMLGKPFNKEKLEDSTLLQENFEKSYLLQKVTNI